jgi:peptidoglycan/LPS O-acetylase OafA/YrhL
MASKLRLAQRVAWIDRLKAVALLWIFLNHASERIFGDELFANPDSKWPPLRERIAQMKPVGGFGFLSPLANLFRDIGWAGDMAVGLFLLLSGFALAWSNLSRPGGPLPPLQFYRRRLGRIYPTWLVAHLWLLVLPAIFALHTSLIDSRLYFSLLGIRITPDQFYFGWSAWWFIGLILQLYFVFPLLWKILAKWGPLPFAIIVCSTAIAIRAAGLFYFSDYLDCWSRGAIFVTRLPEFAIGMSMGVWMFRGARPKAVPMFAGGLIAVAVGTALSFTLGGMAISPFIESAGLFGIFYPLFASRSDNPARLNPISWLDWIGRHSLSLYLVHQPFVRALTRPAATAGMLLRDIAGCGGAVGLTIVAAIMLEWFTELCIRIVGRWHRSPRRLPVGIAAACLVLLVWGGLVAGDQYVRQTRAQEAADLGWGERPSLRPDPIFGWNLIPDKTTRLRWLTYDYTVTANHLGYPGPQYPDAKPPGTYRILVTGDAFTSAEGVDTDKAWPRLLEKKLSASRPTQVMNFAITGYGPNQYLAVVNAYAPRFHPDLILIGLFVNDYGDVLETDDEFRTWIGFGLPDPNGIAARASFRQLAWFARTQAIQHVEHLIHHRDRDGYALGNFHFMEKDCPDVVGEGRVLMKDRLSRIKTIADTLGAKVVIAMIPSGPQVCPKQLLAYWPDKTDLTDADRFDPDLPQRTTKSIADELGIPTFDLRPPLKMALSRGSPYQANNMHWTELGHETAADYLAGVLSTHR